MKEERVIVPSGGLKLEGLLARPDGAASARAAVICHPHPLYGGSMHNNVVEAIVDALWKLGFATLRFNFRGVGESEGEHGGGAGEVEDAAAAVKFILSQPGIGREGAVLAGYSFGAAIAMRAGAELEEISAIVAVALPVTMLNLQAGVFHSKRVILIAGDRDAYCGVSEISKLAERFGGNGALQIIHGADHFFGGDEQAISSAVEGMVGAS
jgi:uncharacterized protein